VKNSKNVIFLFLLIFIILTFTGCRGKLLPNDTISFEYCEDKTVKIINNIDDYVYVDFKVNILDEAGQKLYGQTYRNKRLEKVYVLTFEDIDYNLENTDSLKIEILQVHAFSHLKMIILVFFIMFTVVFLASIFFICRNLQSLENKNYENKEV